MYTFLYYFLLFIIYALFGWILEVINFVIRKHKFINRGFLIGPYCPIYGWSAIIMYFLLEKYLDDPLVLFVMGALIASIIEYITSYTMEKLFNARWWDYSEKSFNINGRICLENAILFGLLALVFMYYVNPFIMKFINSIPRSTLLIISFIIFVLFIIDNTLTFNIMFQVKSKTKAIKKDYTEEMSKKAKRILAEHSYISRRILKSFPDLVIIGNNIKPKLTEKLFKRNNK